VINTVNFNFKLEPWVIILLVIALLFAPAITIIAFLLYLLFGRK